LFTRITFRINNVNLEKFMYAFVIQIANL